MKLTRLLIMTALVIITSTVWTTKISLARLQTTSPDLTTVYATSSAPLNLIVERPGRLWFTLPETSAIVSLIVTSTVEFKFTQFNTPTPNSEPYDLAYANGMIWFTEHASNQIGQLDVATGVIQEFAIPTANSAPTGIAVAPNGHIWFTERAGNRLGRFTPGSNTIDEFPYPTTNAQLEDLAIGGDGKIWATAPEINRVINYNLATGQYFNLPTGAGTRPWSIVTDANHRPWITTNQSDQIGVYVPGTLALWSWYDLPTTNDGLTGLAFQDNGSSWAFWFTGRTSGNLGRLQVQTNGTLISIEQQLLPDSAGEPVGVAIDGDGHVWVTTRSNNAIVQWRPPYFQPAEPHIFLPLILHNPCTPLRAQTPFGVQMYGSTGSLTPYYPYLMESNASWVRVELGWASVEPTNRTPDAYNWAAADAVIGAASEGCLNLVVTHLGAPAWAATSPSGPLDQAPLSELTEYLGALVERYDGDGFLDAPGSPVVRYWELYNEPDVGPNPYESRWGENGALYAQMLAAVYPVIKAANPDAQVVFGGLAYDWFQDQNGPFVREFLDDVLTAGGGAYFDVMNFHFYPLFGPNWTSVGAGLLEKTNFIRNKLQAYNLTKPMIVTEMGWHNNAPPELPSSDQTQMRYVVILYTQSLAANLKFSIWWPLADIGGFYSFNSGLITSDSSPVQKPAFYVYKYMTEALHTAVFERSLTPEETKASDMEVYRFNDTTRQLKLYIAWLNPIDTHNTKLLKLRAEQVTVRDLFGTPSTINDIDDGKRDRTVTIAVGGTPVYIEVNN